MSHQVALTDLPKPILETLPFLKDLKDAEVFLTAAKYEIFANGKYHSVSWGENGPITYCPDIGRKG